MKQLFITLVACMLSVLMMRADEVRTLEIELTEAGTLAQKLEMVEIAEVDSLIVRGCINIDDIRAIANRTVEYYDYYWDINKSNPGTNHRVRMSANLQESVMANNRMDFPIL